MIFTNRCDDSVKRSGCIPRVLAQPTFIGLDYSGRTDSSTSSGVRAAPTTRVTSSAQPNRPRPRSRPRTLFATRQPLHPTSNLVRDSLCLQGHWWTLAHTADLAPGAQLPRKPLRRRRHRGARWSAATLRRDEHRVSPEGGALAKPNHRSCTDKPFHIVGNADGRSGEQSSTGGQASQRTMSPGS